MVRFITISLFLAALLCNRLSVHADTTADSLPELEISLITCSPGAEIYELCGHTALRIRQEPMDIAVNYGTFDFNTPNFVYRFVKGETDYMVTAYPFRYFMEEYSRSGRSVIEQPLNLSQEEAAKLLSMLQENTLPENRTYRYNYVKDNCSTRPLAMIEKALGDTIALHATPGSDTLTTFRDIMRHYHAAYPWYQFGIDLALGSGIDYPVSIREKAFAPLILKEMMDSATINGRPVVKESRVILNAREGCGPLPATPPYMTPLAVGCIVLALVIVVAIHDFRKRKVTRWVDAIMFFIFGLCGLLLSFLVFISVHEATSPNWLLLWLNPLCLIVPIFIYIKKCGRLVKLYGFINFAALILLIVMWGFTGQSGNPAFIPLIAADIILTVRYLYITLCAEKTNSL